MQESLLLRYVDTSRSVRKQYSSENPDNNCFQKFLAIEMSATPKNSIDCPFSRKHSMNGQIDSRKHVGIYDCKTKHFVRL